MGLRQRLKQHIRNNRWQYLVISLVFLIGLGMGPQKVAGLEGGVRDYLGEMIDNYLQEGQEAPIYGASIFLAAALLRGKPSWLSGFGINHNRGSTILAVVFCEAML